MRSNTITNAWPVTAQRQGSVRVSALPVAWRKVADRVGERFLPLRRRRGRRVGRFCLVQRVRNLVILQPFLWLISL